MNLTLPHSVFILTVVPCFHGSEQSPSESLMQCGDLARDLNNIPGDGFVFRVKLHLCKIL